MSSKKPNDKAVRQLTLVAAPGKRGTTTRFSLFLGGLPASLGRAVLGSTTTDPILPPVC